jgi:hypothetical protein
VTPETWSNLTRRAATHQHDPAIRNETEVLPDRRQGAAKSCARSSGRRGRGFESRHPRVAERFKAGDHDRVARRRCRDSPLSARTWMGRGDDAANRCPAHQLRQIHHIRVGESAISTSANPPRSPVTVARGGNELCVIEPGNNYLAGTGYLGEVTFDGTLDVGLFWRDALGWPLVWDKDEQTAVQSPVGGTKISWDSWGGPAGERKNGRNRQRFDLVTADPTIEAQRLVSLGATPLADRPDGVELADPDRNEFVLHSSARGEPAPHHVRADSSVGRTEQSGTSAVIETAGARRATAVKRGPRIAAGGPGISVERASCAA